MKLSKAMVCISLAASIGACKKKNDDTPNGTSITQASSGLSLKADSPFAQDLPLFASCGWDNNATVESHCAARTVPFIGNRGQPITRDLIKEHAVASSEASKALLEAFIDEIPDGLLPLFARVRMITDSLTLTAGTEETWAYGMLNVSGFLGFECDPRIPACRTEPVELSEGARLVRTFLSRTPEERMEPAQWLAHVSMVSDLCEIAEAHGTRDLQSLQSEQDAKGSLSAEHVALKDDYPHKLSPKLVEYFAQYNKEKGSRRVFSSDELIAGLDDPEATANISAYAYQSKINDFLSTCREYVVSRAYNMELGLVVLDGKTGEVFKTRKGQLGNAAMKSKLLKMLPAIYLEPSAEISFVEAMPTAQPLTDEELGRIIKNYHFEP